MDDKKKGGEEKQAGDADKGATRAPRSLSPSDLSLLQFNACEKDAVDSFLTRYINASYSLAPDERINMATGEIVKPPKTPVIPRPPQPPASPEHVAAPAKTEAKP